MKLGDFLSDCWLACGVIGMAIGLAAPVAFVFYLLWRWVA